MLIEWKKLGKRINPLNFFSTHAKITIEIGFGKGDFLESYSKIYGENLIGIEISEYSVKNAVKRLSKYNNIRIIHAEAFFAIGHLFKESTIDKIFILFPDPWPKRRHEKKRFLNREFFDRAAYVLKENGEIFMITDEKKLAEYTEEKLSKTKHFLVKPPPPEYLELAKNTKYGKKWQNEKKNFFPFYLVKRGKIKKYWGDILISKRFDHLTIKNFDLSEFIKKVETIYVREERKFICFKNFYKNRNSFILEFILKEETLLQHIFFKGEFFKNKCVIKPLNKEDIVFTKGFFEILRFLSL